jgi:anti-anti-sigma regulatory factor
MDNQEVADNTDATATVIDCSGMQDIANTTALYQRLSDILTAGNPVILDASHTERLDAAAAQLLYAFVRAANAQGVAVTWQQPSDAVGNAARLLGMREGLGLAGC